MHQFTYALYPHKGNWQSAGTVRRGYELNMPLEVINYPDVEASSHRPLKPMGQLLDLQAENLILMAFKPKEDTPQQWILRCYECHGSVAELSLKSDLNLAIAHPIDLLEQPSQTSETLSDRQTIRVNPWKIATFLVTNDQESAGVQPPTSNY
jgi:alpha-mannosidase